MPLSPASATTPAARCVLRGAALAAALVASRGAVILGLELTHHGGTALAFVRLSNALPPLLGGAALLAAFLACGLGESTRTWRHLLVGVLGAVLVTVFLGGGLDPDPSRRVGTETPRGQLALAVFGGFSIGLAALAVWGSARARPRSAAGARALAIALVPCAVACFWLRWRHAGLAPTLERHHVEAELVGELWEVLRAHADGPPEPCVLAPSNEFSPAAAARPALSLPPPARVRRRVGEAHAVYVLQGGAAVDATMAEEAASRYPGHHVRLRLSIDGRMAFEARLPVAGSAAWAEFGAGAGLPVPGGSLLELESALLDPEGREVDPPDPLRAGFGGLELERRAVLPRAPAAAGPSVVLIVLDTLRADRTSAYGYPRATTPHLEALARRGVLFEEAHATSSWTWPSTASILTGLLPEQHGVEDAASSFLPERLDTLAEALQREGFTTAAWSGSPLIVPDKQFDQGFEFFEASREGILRRTHLFLPAIEEWLGTASEWRFFLYLHLMEPHAPSLPRTAARELFAADVPRDYDPYDVLAHNWTLQREGFGPDGIQRTDAVVPPAEQRWISDLYDASVWSADYYVGAVLRRLEELGLSESTIVAVTADHGEELFDHGLVSHAHGLHRELVRVPLVLAGPGVPRGERHSFPVSGAALAPTLARLAGAEITGLEDLAGLDLLEPADAPTLFSTSQGWWNGRARQPLFGLRKGSFVLHFAPEGGPFGSSAPAPGGELRLFDLAEDPGENRDLSRATPERARAMLEELRACLAALEAARVRSNGVVDPGTLERMRALGYVGK